MASNTSCPILDSLSNCFDAVFALVVLAVGPSSSVCFRDDFLEIAGDLGAAFSATVAVVLGESGGGRGLALFSNMVRQGPEKLNRLLTLAVFARKITLFAQVLLCLLRRRR